VGLASDVHRTAQINDHRAGSDDDGIVGESGGESKGGNGSLVGVHVGMVLLPCILLRLASGGALATVLLLLLLATLLLLWWPVPSLLLLSLLLLLWWSLLLLLELGVPRVALNGADFVHMVAQLLLPRLVLLPGNERHSLNISKGWKRVYLLLLFLAL